MDAMELGPAYTTGSSYRARAEQRAREYRARSLRAGWDRYGHMLDAPSAGSGANFVTSAAHSAAKVRAASGKGVGKRTFENMLSSQAMCFNIFAPLARDLELAAAVLHAMVPGIKSVTRIQVEFTPPQDIFRDQGPVSGVDCDLYIDAVWEDGIKATLVVETKFVEPEFSVCKFTTGEASATCASSTVQVRDNPTACLYTSSKGYLYWPRTREVGNINLAVLPEAGCPFGGPHWQLWVNHTLAHVLAARAGVQHVAFGVCAAKQNTALLGDGQVLEGFRNLLTERASLLFLPLDELLEAIRVHATAPQHAPWVSGLTARYANI